MSSRRSSSRGGGRAKAVGKEEEQPAPLAPLDATTTQASSSITNDIKEQAQQQEQGGALMAKAGEKKKEESSSVDMIPSPTATATVAPPLQDSTNLPPPAAATADAMAVDGNGADGADGDATTKTSAATTTTTMAVAEGGGGEGEQKLTPRKRKAAAAAAGANGGSGEEEEGKRPSRYAINMAAKEAADKASRSARCYAPLPYQLKRLFFRSDPCDVKIAGRTLKLVHKDPHVYSIEDFITESEYDYFEALIDQQYGKFRASYTDEDCDSKILDEYRTSAFIALRKGGDKAVRSIEARAAEIVGLSTDVVEPLQMVGYRQHDKFDLHHDMGTYDDKTRQVEAVSPRRLVTFFLYLNNLPKGEGHTVFPMIGRPKSGGLSMQPQRLKAVLWCNVLENGEPDPRLVHRADPVREEGLLKFGVNIWLTDKNLQALALSSSGATLNPHKHTRGRSILSMLDEPCEVCHGRSDANKILLCDHCDLGYHMHCLDPPLRKIPTTAWMCPDCDAKGRKPRKGDYCEVCQGGLHEHRMVLCDDCDRAYHTYCLEPKLRRVPKDDWYCQRCTRKREGGEDGGSTRKRKKKQEEEKDWGGDPDYPGCQGCKQKDRLEDMLLCDGSAAYGCEAEWHISCLDPPLTQVPEGDWLCPCCSSKRAEEEERKRKEEARLRVGDWIIITNTTEAEAAARLGKITAITPPAAAVAAPTADPGCSHGGDLLVRVVLAMPSTQRVRQGVKFLPPPPEGGAAEEVEEVTEDRVLGKVCVEVRGPTLFVDTTNQPLARQHLLPL